MKTELQVHEAANEFPLFDDARYSELVEDIRLNGLREPIRLCQGKIIDGRNRYKACLQLGIDPRLVTIPDDVDPFSYVWSLNGQRRDLTKDQRYAIWLSINRLSEQWQERAIQEEANRKRSQAAKQQPRTPDGSRMAGASTTSGRTSKKRGKGSAAKAAASSTNRGTVERMDRIARDRPDLFEKVKSGELAGTAAERQMVRNKALKKVAEFPSGKFRVVYADPPWKYNDALGGTLGPSYGGAEGHYPTLTMKELMALPVKEHVDDNAVLFLWVTSPLLFESQAVFKAWGFAYKTAFIWDKVKHNMGHYNSVRHELLLVCTRGSCTPDVNKLFDSVLSIERTKKHSEKPEEFRKIIDTLYPHGRRVEMFARGPVPEPWESWGAEAGE